VSHHTPRKEAKRFGKKTLLQNNLRISCKKPIQKNPRCEQEREYRRTVVGVLLRRIRRVRIQGMSLRSHTNHRHNEKTDHERKRCGLIPLNVASQPSENSIGYLIAAGKTKSNLKGGGQEKQNKV